MKKELFFGLQIIAFTLLLSTSLLYSQDRFEPIVNSKRNYAYCPRPNGFVARDGGYLVINGIIQTYGEIKGHERVSKYDINGNLLWYKDIRDFMIVGICELYDSSIVLCGPQSSNHWDGDPYNEFKTTYMVKLNPCGDVEWAKIDKAGDYPGDVYLNKFFLRTVIDTGDGLIFPYRSDATFQDPTGGHETYEFNTYLLKLSYDGDIIYRKGFKEYGGSQELWGGEG